METSWRRHPYVCDAVLLNIKAPWPTRFFALRFHCPIKPSNPKIVQTFTDWKKVPSHLEAKVRKFWNGCGTATYDKSHDRNGDPITVYKLADYKVALNTDYLTDNQKIKLFEIASERSIILQDLLHSLSFEIESVRVHDEIYHLPGIVKGTWPHCGLFGGMDETGYIHT